MARKKISVNNNLETWENHEKKALIYSNLSYTEFDNVIWFAEPKVGSTHLVNVATQLQLRRYMYGEHLEQGGDLDYDGDIVVEPQLDSKKRKLILIRDPMRKFCSGQSEEILRMLSEWNSDQRSLIVWCAAKNINPNHLKDFYDRLRGSYYAELPMLNDKKKPTDYTTEVGIEFIKDMYSTDFDTSPIFHQAHTSFRLFPIYSYFKKFENVNFLDITDLDNAVDWIEELIPGYSDIVNYKKYTLWESDFDESGKLNNSVIQGEGVQADKLFGNRKSHIVDQLKSLTELKEFQNISYMDNIVDEDLQNLIDNEYKIYNEIINSDSFLKF